MSKKRKVKKAEKDLVLNDAVLENVEEVSGYRYPEGVLLERHEHIWDIARTVQNGHPMPIMRGEGDEPYILFSPYDENTTWNGPLTCGCGQARWLVDGHSGLRRPNLSNIDGTIAVLKYLGAKAESGEELTIEEERWLKEFVDEFQKLIKPLMDALTGLASAFAEYLTETLNSSSWDWVRRMSEAYSESAVVGGEIKTVPFQAVQGYPVLPSPIPNPYPGMTLSPMSIRDGR